MANDRTHIHNSMTSNMVAWSPPGAHMQHETEDEVAAEVDEPPDVQASTALRSQFQRTKVTKHKDHSQSLLTKALHDPPEEEPLPLGSSRTTRRRSMNSNISLASTADLTSDTGLTSPARTNTPSPPPPVIQLGRLNVELFGKEPRPPVELVSNMHKETTPPAKSIVVANADSQSKNAPVEALAKKRCISFACGPKPEAKKPVSSPPAMQLNTQPPAAPTSQQEAPRKTSIKFACSIRPGAEDSKTSVPDIIKPPTKERRSSSAIRKHRSPSTVRSQRSLTPRQRTRSPVVVRSKKYLAANTVDLNCESSRFHEFASDEPQEDDWIRQNPRPSGRRLTINDLLQKENEIRRLGKEAEEEAEQEEAEEEEEEQDEPEDEDTDEDDNDAPDDEDEDDDEIEEDLDDGYVNDDDFSGYGSDDDASDGYNTDNEGGFAESDDEDEGGLQLWCYSNQVPALQLAGISPINRRPSMPGNRSDSSASSIRSKAQQSRDKSRRIKIRPGTPELPDSTDFVCGTLDEDRPLEDAYISCIAQKRREKLHLIPQDIDPSFPTSDPEDEEDEAESYKAAHDSDDNIWIHGPLEDLHHEQDRNDRRKKKVDHASPKRYHSPPPKARGRSPRRPFDRHSPRRLVSPAPSSRTVKPAPALPSQTATHGHHVEYKNLPFRSGQNQTKSLPRAPAIFPNHLKGQRRRQAALTGTSRHVRGAIDIVKGLEHKRQRRKEKYIQKHCNRARKGQVAEKRPQPGLGAERMRELGLLKAGKHPGRYVLSV